MAFGSGFSNFFGDVYEGMTTADDLKDYRHASKLFLSDGYALAPQTKFLFHVYFTLNTAEIPGLRQAFGSLQDTATIGMMVKTADLPKFSMDVEEKNQYNRRRYVQSKINYNPVSITFHDDGSDLVRSMWNAYYTYYYEDSLHQYDNVGADADLAGWSEPMDFNRRDIYDNLRSVNNWGYSGTGNASGYKPNFFKDIKIYGLNRGNFTQYTLINPIITDWSHDTFDYQDGSGVMTNNMTVRYETVKYARGNIGTAGNTSVKGFADPAVYDDEPSMFGKPGATDSIFGAGGLLDAGVSIYDDLASGNILGALVTGATAYENFSGINDQELEDVGSAVLGGVITGALTSPAVANAASNFLFPTAETQTSNSQNQIAQLSNNGLTSSKNSTPPSNSNWINPDQNYNTRGSQPTDVNSNGVPVNSAWRNPDE
jgi:hypothetical protein